MSLSAPARLRTDNRLPLQAILCHAKNADGCPTSEPRTSFQGLYGHVGKSWSRANYGGGDIAGRRSEMISKMTESSLRRCSADGPLLIDRDGLTIAELPSHLLQGPPPPDHVRGRLANRSLHVKISRSERKATH